MKWLVVLTLALLGLVEFVLRATVLLALVASVVGLVVLLGFEDARSTDPSDMLSPTLWRLAESVSR